MKQLLDGQTGATCRPIGHRYVVDEPGCDLAAVNVNICSGTCWSLSFVDPRQQQPDKDGEAEEVEAEEGEEEEEATVSVFAQCCRMDQGIKLNISIPCEDGPRTVQIPSATKCSCFDCSRRRRK